VRSEGVRTGTDWGILAALAAFSYFFLFPRVEWVWIYLAFPALLFLKERREGLFFRRTVLDWGIGLLLVQVLVTCLVVKDLGFSLPKVTGTVFGVMVFYALAGVLDSRARIRAAVLFFLVGAGLLTAVSFLGMRFSSETFVSQSYSGIERMMAGFRRIAPFVDFGSEGAEEGFNSNAVAGTALLSLPLILLAPYIFGAGWRRRATRGTGGGTEPEGSRDEGPRRGIIILSTTALFLVFGGILFLTLSMGSWLALLGAVWLVALVAGWRKRRLVAVTVLVFVFIFFPGGVLKKDRGGEHWLQGKWELRKEIMLIGLAVVKDRPWSGIGMNQLRKLTMIEYHRSHAHNHFLHTAAELGIPGLVAYLAVLAGAGYMVAAVWRKGKDDFLRWVVLGLGAGQFAHMVFGLADSIPLGAKPGIVFWVSLGVIAAVYNHERERAA